MRYRVDVLAVADASRNTLNAGGLLDEAMRTVLSAADSCGSAVGEAAGVRAALEAVFAPRGELAGAVTARVVASVEAVTSGTVAFIEADREMVATASAGDANVETPTLAGWRAQ